MGKPKHLKTTKKRQLTFNQIVAKKPKRSYRAQRKIAPILRQTFFIETAEGLIDYTQPASNIALQAAILYARTMYLQPEYALEFAAIAHKYAEQVSDMQFAEAMQKCWQATQDYVLYNKITLPVKALGIDPRKQLGNAEYYIYSMLGKGKSVAEIAKILGRTMLGVNATITNIRKKIKVKTIQQVRIHSRDIGVLK